MLKFKSRQINTLSVSYVAFMVYPVVATISG